MALRHSIQFNSSSSMAMIFGVTPASSYAKPLGSHDPHKKDEPLSHSIASQKDTTNSNEKKGIELGAYRPVTTSNFSRCHNNKEYSKTELAISAYNYNESLKLKTLKPKVKHPTIIPHKIFTLSEKKVLMNETIAHNSQLMEEKQKKEQLEKQQKRKLKVSIEENVNLINDISTQKKILSTIQMQNEIRMQLAEKNEKRTKERDIQNQANNKLKETEKAEKQKEEQIHRIQKANDYKQKIKYHHDLTVQTSRPKPVDKTIETGLKLESYRKLKL